MRERGRGTRCALVLALIAAGATIAACSSSAALPPFDGNIPLGTWGGDSAGVIVSDSAMHVHVACTYGDVSGRVPVGVDGSFSATGSYLLRAYPVTVGPTMPAVFAGRLNGATLTMTVTVQDTVQHQTVVRGPVVVKYGATPNLGPCPICRR